MAISSDLERLLARWLPRQRWMPALGGSVGEEPDITPLSVARIAEVSDDDAGTVQCLLVVLTVRGPRRHTRLCVPLSIRTVEDYSLRSHLVGVVDDLLLGKSYVYDGAADPVFVLALADAIVDGHADRPTTSSRRSLRAMSFLMPTLNRLAGHAPEPGRSRCWSVRVNTASVGPMVWAVNRASRSTARPASSPSRSCGRSVP